MQLVFDFFTTISIGLIFVALLIQLKLNRELTKAIWELERRHDK